MHQGDGAAAPLALEACQEPQPSHLQELLLQHRLQGRDDEEDPEQIEESHECTLPPVPEGTRRPGDAPWPWSPPRSHTHPGGLPVQPPRAGYRPAGAPSVWVMAIRFGLAASLLGSRSSNTPLAKLALIFSASTVVGS